MLQKSLYGVLVVAVLVCVGLVTWLIAAAELNRPTTVATHESTIDGVGKFVEADLSDGTKIGHLTLSRKFVYEQGWDGTATLFVTKVNDRWRLEHVAFGLPGQMEQLVHVWRESNDATLRKLWGDRYKIIVEASKGVLGPVT